MNVNKPSRADKLAILRRFQAESEEPKGVYSRSDMLAFLSDALWVLEDSLASGEETSMLKKLRRDIKDRQTFDGRRTVRI